jgi:hypothetical protein
VAKKAKPAKKKTVPVKKKALALPKRSAGGKSKPVAKKKRK